MSCSILIIHRGTMSPTLNVNPTLFVVPCNLLRGLCIYNVAIIVNYQVIFHPNFKSSMAIFHHKLLTKEGRVLANG